MKQQLLVDMDGVLADVYAQFAKFEFEHLGIERQPHELEGLLEMKAFTHAEEYVRTKNFFRTAPVMEGSQEGLKYLNDKYKVLIVSSAT